MNLHRGLARIAVTVSVILTVLSFIVGPAVYKTLVKPSFYLVPGAGESLIRVFGRAQAARLADSPEIKRDRGHRETTPGLLSPLPLPARADLPFWEWALAGVMTALAGFVAIAVAIGVTTGVTWWIRDGFWDERGSNQGSHPEDERCVEDLITETTIDIDMLAPAKGLCYEELVGLGSEEFDLRDWNGGGKNGRDSRSEGT